MRADPRLVSECARKVRGLTRMGLRCTVLAGDEPILGLGSSRVSEQSGTGATKVACKAYGLDLQVNPVDG